MINSANHILMRQITELETSSREAAFDLQWRIGAWCRNVLPALLDQICTRCDGSDRIFRIDRLEIDLGQVSALRLEEEIGEKTATLLYEALRDKVDRLRLGQNLGAAAGRPQHGISGSPQRAAAGSGDRMLAPVDADLELILYFLDRGSLPWSTVVGAVTPLEEMLKKLTETAPDRIDAMLTFVAGRPVARRRLIVQFSHDLLWLLARRGSTDGGLRLERWHHDFEAAVSAADFNQTVAIELRESFWDSAFEHLAVLTEKSFATTEFWRQTVSTAAARSGLGAEKIIAALIKGARQAIGTSMSLQSEVTITLNQLTGQLSYGSDRFRLSPTASLSTARQTETEISSKTSDSVLRLQKKARRAPKVEKRVADLSIRETPLSPADRRSSVGGQETLVSSSARPEVIDDPFIGETQTSPADQRSSRHGRETPVRSSARPGPQDSFHKPRLSVPGSDDEKLTALTRGGAAAGQSTTDARGTVPDRVNERQASRSEFSDGYRPRSRYPESKASAQISTAEKAASTDLSGIDTDTALQEVYVDNAGLVIVWPFLSHFFRTLALLEKNDFVDDRSKTRAIYLLQYLTTGEEKFSEYLLPLNKVLCGWEIGEPLGREYRLSGFEKSESRTLLEAVISHWAALKQTSVDGLRTSFLQRNAVLFETMRHWLLRVERKPYDMLLERLPWGISMIRLSWMPKMLTVEW